ncbi:FMN-dependent NADH-azoreductase [Allostreptomyces psammosilenae]|uniref:FMN dependent NADH:quinone oxidoreductase n=1 Tax=Allostreptomyces psammosilenae TaxID=1892865 RepID=A0A853ABS1_9ACTN|nr:NAD(P)H-dependent oxidoreductase [Allostreptomyces psammosilenae]NYI07822.1 FMN-dependent NADH-azoreductase [Allostreptomyces psammosilenae]
MAHLLHIDASALSQGSVSRDVSAIFRRAWEEQHPEGVVTYRDLAANPLPHLDEAAITARSTPAESRTAEQRAAAAVEDELIEELLKADAYLIGVPMYNFSVPSTLKAWLDWILSAGRTFGMDPKDSPIAGRPVTLISSRGGAYGPGTPRDGWDYAEPFLQQVLAKALGLDVTVITAELTMAHLNPAMAELRPAAEASRASAEQAAAAQAKEVLSRLGV